LRACNVLSFKKAYGKIQPKKINHLTPDEKNTIIPSFFLNFSCKKDDHYTETITKGSKWGIKIGSTPPVVYKQLQELAIEKGFSQAAVVYRQHFSKPQEIQNHLSLYQIITLQNSSGAVERAIIRFNEHTITSIEAGGALPAEIIKWPQDASDETAIHKNDPVELLYTKLLKVFQMPGYGSWKIILPDKPLSLPFDPDMANYPQWAFSFSEDIAPGKRGSSSVRLFFRNGKLSKIEHNYDESKFVD